MSPCPELSSAVASAEKSLKFLEQTIVMVEANRSKFEHIDNVRPCALAASLALPVNRKHVTDS